MGLFTVCVKPDYPINTVQVGGQVFSKLDQTLVHEINLTDEIKNSPLLIVAPVTESPETQVPEHAALLDSDASETQGPALIEETDNAGPATPRRRRNH